jgi:hydroxypyruvate reductase
VGRELDGARALGGRATFAAFATDGVDGSSGAAGAIVDERLRARAEARLGPRALDEALARFDTGTLHRVTGTALPLRPSGHNLADLHVLVLWR